MLGRVNVGWTASKNGHTCPCRNYSQEPPAEKTGSSLLNRPPCPPPPQHTLFDDLIGQGTKLNWFASHYLLPESVLFIPGFCQATRILQQAFQDVSAQMPMSLCESEWKCAVQRNWTSVGTTFQKDNCVTSLNQSMVFSFSTALIRCEKFGLFYLGKATAVARAALPIPDSAWVIFECPNKGTAANACDRYCVNRC